MRAMNTQQRKPPKQRKAELLEAALQVAEATGYVHLTRQAVADKAGVVPSLVTHRFSTMADLRRSVMRQAIKREILPIIAQGLAVRDPHALKAPVDLQHKALKSLGA